MSGSGAAFAPGDQQLQSARAGRRRACIQARTGSSGHPARGWASALATNWLADITLCRSFRDTAPKLSGACVSTRCRSQVGRSCAQQASAGWPVCKGRLVRPSALPSLAHASRASVRPGPACAGSCMRLMRTPQPATARAPCEGCCVAQPRLRRGAQQVRVIRAHLRALTVPGSASSKVLFGGGGGGVAVGGAAFRKSTLHSPASGADVKSKSNARTLSNNSDDMLSIVRRVAAHVGTGTGRRRSRHGNSTESPRNMTWRHGKPHGKAKSAPKPRAFHRRACGDVPDVGR